MRCVAMVVVLVLVLPTAMAQIPSYQLSIDEVELPDHPLESGRTYPAYVHFTISCGTSAGGQGGRINITWAQASGVSFYGPDFSEVRLPNCPAEASVSGTEGFEVQVRPPAIGLAPIHIPVNATLAYRPGAFWMYDDASYVAELTVDYHGSVQIRPARAWTPTEFGSGLQVTVQLESDSNAATVHNFKLITGPKDLKFPAQVVLDRAPDLHQAATMDIQIISSAQALCDVPNGGPVLAVSAHPQADPSRTLPTRTITLPGVNKSEMCPAFLSSSAVVVPALIVGPILLLGMALMARKWALK